MLAAKITVPIKCTPPFPKDNFRMPTADSAEPVVRRVTRGQEPKLSLDGPRTPQTQGGSGQPPRKEGS